MSIANVCTYLGFIHQSLWILNNIRLSSWHLPLLPSRLQSGKGMAWLIIQRSWHSDFQVLGLSCSVLSQAHMGCSTHEAESFFQSSTLPTELSRPHPESFLKVRSSKLWTKGEDIRWGKQTPGRLVPVAIRLNAIKPGIRRGADNSPGGQSLVD